MSRDASDPRQRVDNSGVFRVRRLSLIGFIAAIVLSIVSLLLRSGRDGKSPEASAYSYSAIGHHGFRTWLEKLGVPLRVAPNSPTRDLAPGDTLVVLAPEPCETDTRCHRFSYNIRRALDAGANVLVALPRWTAIPHERRPAIAAELNFHSPEDVAEVLARTVIAARRSVRPFEVEKLLEDELEFENAVDALGAAGSPGYAVKSDDPSQQWALDLAGAQVLSHSYAETVTPIVDVGFEDVFVAGRIRDTRVLVVTDPTIFGNAAFADGDHADLIAWLLFEILETKAVIIDETAHAQASPPRVWDSLFEMPLLPLTLQVIIVFVMMLWMGGRRFALPARDNDGKARGTQALIDASAALMEEGAAAGPALAAYWEMTVRDMARSFSLPSNLSHDERVARLRALETTRGVGAIIDDLCARVALLEALPRRRRVQHKILTTAKDIYRLRESIAHGYSTN